MVQLLYFRDIAAGAFNQLQFGGTAPATLTTAEGWTVGTVTAGQYSQFERNVERPTSTFTFTEVPPDTGPNNTLGDGFRTANFVNGWFAAGTWTVALSVIAVTAGGAHDGRLRVRVWKTSSLSGAAAVELTDGVQEGTTVLNLAVGVQQVSTVTFTLPEFGCVDEHLFFSVAWRTAGAGATSNDDVLWREGATSVITAPDFTVATTTEYPIVLAGHGLLVTKGDYVRRMAQRFAMQLSTDPQHGLRLGEFSTVIPSWEGGHGFESFDKDNPNRYYTGLGIDVHSANGKAQAGYELQTSFASSQDGFSCMAAYDGRLFAGSTTGRVYEFNGSAWTLSNDLNKLSGVAFLKVYKGQGSGGLFAGNHNDGEISRLNNTTWEEPYINLNQGEARDIGQGWYGYYYGYYTNPPTNTLINYAPAVMKGRFWGWEVSDNAGYTIGFDDNEHADSRTDLLGDKFILGQVVDQDVYFVTSDSDSNKTFIYKLAYPMGEVRDVPEENVVEKSVGEAHQAAALVYTIGSNNATCYTINGNSVYLGCGERGEVYSFELGGTEEPKLLASGLTENDDAINGIAFWSGACWVSGRSGDKLILSRIDPETGAVSTPVYGGIVSNSSNAVRALATYNGKLYVSTYKTGDARIYRVDSDLREISAVTLQVPTITFETPVIITRVRADHSALSSGDTVSLYIAENGSKDYRLLGTNGSRRSASTSYPVSIIGSVNNVSVKIEINANSTAESPRIGQLTVTARPIGEVTREWPIAIHAYGNAAYTERRKDGSLEPRTGQAIIDSMWRVMEEGRVQRFRDVDNQVYEVTVEDWEDYPEGALGHAAGLRWTARFRLREV